MNYISNFGEKHFMAISLPPIAHPSLPTNFQELSRIHFYLGRSSIDEMVEAVEQSSLEDIERGQIQIYFATKEIQEFLFSTLPELSYDEESLEPSYYFQKSFHMIFKDSLFYLQKIFDSPSKENNIHIIETMMPLIQEIILFNEELQKIEIHIDLSKDLDNIQNLFQKIVSLKDIYPNLQKIQSFDFYQEQAKKSLQEQLDTPYQFNYQELEKIYKDDDHWIETVHYLSKKILKTEEPNYSFQYAEMQDLKNNFLIQFKSFNQLLKPGIINFIHAFSASISKEIAKYVSLSQKNPEQLFQAKLQLYANLEKKTLLSKSEFKQKIEELKKSKDDFIQKEIENLAYYEKQLIILRRQEKNILDTIEKIQSYQKKLSPQKETIIFEGDISQDFVIGKFSSLNKILLVHKDNFVEQPEAVYAMILDQNTYQNLVEHNQLIFNKEFKKINCISASNFYNYGQFLQEISSPNIQKFFLGQEFELIDKTIISNSQKTKKLKTR